MEIFEAIDAGDLDAVTRLVQEQPELARARDANGLSPILHALYRGQTQMVPVLLNGGEAQDIFDAGAAGQSSRVRALLQKRPESARSTSLDGFTPLHYVAFFSGDVPSAEALLQAGADASAVAGNPSRVQPLHSAMAGRNYAVAHLLVERGADVNARQEGGFTPLMAAAQNGDREEVKWLIAQGADLSILNDRGTSAADLAREAGHEDLGISLLS